LFFLGLVHCGIAGFYYSQVYGGIPYSDYKTYSYINAWLLIILLILEVLEAIYLMLWKCFGKKKQLKVLYGEAVKSPMLSKRQKVYPLALDIPIKRVRTKDGRIKEWGLPRELGFEYDGAKKTWDLPNALGFIVGEGKPKQKNYNPTGSIRTNFTRGALSSPVVDEGDEYIVSRKQVRQSYEIDAQGNRRVVEDRIRKICLVSKKF
jgi:hypothetical protein